jgi:oligoribonuclease
MIAWIDLETTGLNSRLCSIIEVACVVTDDNLDELGSYETLIKPPRNVWIDEAARNLHVKSGLWGLAKNAPSGGISRADRELSRLLSGFREDGKFKPLILGGSSVHFDRSFIEYWMPKTNACLHYRNLDMSSIKIFVSGAFDYPTEKLPGRKEDSKHRAADDIRVSLEAARWYKDHLIFCPGGARNYLSLD